MAITVYTYNDKVLKNVATDKWLKKAAAPLPPIPTNTIRVRTSDGNAPVKGTYTSYDTATLVTGTSDVYDVYKSGTSFSGLLIGSTNVIEILGGETSNITDMSWMCDSCTALTTVALFDTSSVTDMSAAFNGCSSLTSVPLFDLSNATTINNTFFGCSIAVLPAFNTSNVTDMNGAFRNNSALTTIPLFNTSKVTQIGYAFANCTNVESGALALYNQMSTQSYVPSLHGGCFYNCGSNTQTGAAELAQIPSSWGGTAS